MTRTQSQDWVENNEDDSTKERKSKSELRSLFTVFYLTRWKWIEFTPQSTGLFIMQDFLEEKAFQDAAGTASYYIATCDFLLFTKIKSHLKGIHHDGEDEVKEAVTTVLKWLTSLDHQRWFESWEQCWCRSV